MIDSKVWMVSSGLSNRPGFSEGKLGVRKAFITLRRIFSYGLFPAVLLFPVSFSITCLFCFSADEDSPFGWDIRITRYARKQKATVGEVLKLFSS